LQAMMDVDAKELKKAVESLSLLKTYNPENSRISWLSEF
jgi:hypothetical protein